MSEIKYLTGYDEFTFKGMKNVVTQCPTKEESLELQNQIKQALKLMELVEENIREGRNLFFLASLLEEAKK